MESKKITYKSDRSMTSQRLQQSSRTDQKLEDCLRKIDSKNAYAFNAHVTAQLTGIISASTVIASVGKPRSVAALLVPPVAPFGITSI